MIEIEYIYNDNVGINTMRYRENKRSPWKFPNTVHIKDLPKEERPNYRKPAIKQKTKSL